MKVNGKLCYLWRAVDHEGEVLEAVVTAKRDKAAALKLLKRIMKKYGRPRSIVTDGLCAYSAAMKEIGDAPIGTRSAVGSTIGRRIRISRFGDENGRCSAFEVRRRCRSSAQFMPRCTTNSIRSAISSRGKSTSRDALLPWLSGALSRHRSPLARWRSRCISTSLHDFDTAYTLDRNAGHNASRSRDRSSHIAVLRKQTFAT